MRITYDPEMDVLRIIFRDVQVEESNEVRPGIILDYGHHGDVVGLEVLDASTRLDNPRAIDYTVIG